VPRRPSRRSTFGRAAGAGAGRRGMHGASPPGDWPQTSCGIRCPSSAISTPATGTRRLAVLRPVVLAAGCPPQQLGRALGRLAAATGVGGVVGPLLSAPLLLGAQLPGEQGDRRTSGAHAGIQSAMTTSSAPTYSGPAGASGQMTCQGPGRARRVRRVTLCSGAVPRLATGDLAGARGLTRCRPHPRPPILFSRARRPADETARTGVRGSPAAGPRLTPTPCPASSRRRSHMPSTAVPPDLVLAAVRACSTSARSDRTVHRLLQGSRRQEHVARSGVATRPTRTTSSA
jgi:hypothetical protein